MRTETLITAADGRELTLVTFVSDDNMLHLDLYSANNAHRIMGYVTTASRIGRTPDGDLRVDVLNEDGSAHATNIPLSDAMPDDDEERRHVAAAVRKDQDINVGGGAAPLLTIRPASCLACGGDGAGNEIWQSCTTCYGTGEPTTRDQAAIASQARHGFVD